MEQSSRNWFIAKLANEVFLIFFISWVILFLMESLKSGIVSNYVSLPHMAVLILALGIIALTVQEPPKAISEKKLSRKAVFLLFCFSVVLTLSIDWYLNLSAALTVLIIFVTVVSLWLGTIVLRSRE